MYRGFGYETATDFTRNFRIHNIRAICPISSKACMPAVCTGSRFFPESEPTILFFEDVWFIDCDNTRWPLIKHLIPNVYPTIIRTCIGFYDYVGP